MRFDAPPLARAWQSVALASGNDKTLPSLHRTVAIEEYVHGVRLVATDRFMLLTAWVPNIDTDTDTEPLLEEAPDRTVVAADVDHRGKSLLAYVVQLEKRASLASECEVVFDVRLPAGQTGTDATLEGMEPGFTVFSVPDVEKVYLPVVEATYPGWRTLLDGFVSEKTDTIGLALEQLTRLGKLSAWNPGHLAWKFGGSERAAYVDLPMSDPHVTGIVMPVRWVTDQDPPEPPRRTPARTTNEAPAVRAFQLD
jgi:hypothetical protein